MFKQLAFLSLALAIVSVLSGCGASIETPKLPHTDPPASPQKIIPSPEVQDLVINTGEAAEMNHIRIVSSTQDEKTYTFKLQPAEKVKLSLSGIYPSYSGCSLNYDIASAFALLELNDRDEPLGIEVITVGNPFELKAGAKYSLAVGLKGIKSCTEIDFQFLIQQQ
jgi:hypothetical protein